MRLDRFSDKLGAVRKYRASRIKADPKVTKGGAFIRVELSYDTETFSFNLTKVEAQELGAVFSTASILEYLES